MDVTTINLRYRPVRIGFCVPRGDFAALEKAIQLNTTLWGGRFNPILPISEGNRPKALVSSFRPDYLFPIGEKVELNDFVSGYPELGGYRWDPKYTNRDEKTLPYLMPSLSAVYAEDSRSTIKFGQVVSEVSIVKWSQDDPLRYLLLCQHGGFPAEDLARQESELRSHWSTVDYHVGGNKPLLDPHRLLSPIGLTAGGLESANNNYNSAFQSLGIFVGDATRFDDLCTYWNLMAAGYRTHFLDANKLDRCLKVVEEAVFAEECRPGYLATPFSAIYLWGANPRAVREISESFDNLHVRRIYCEEELQFIPFIHRVALPSDTVLGTIGDAPTHDLNFLKPTSAWKSGHQLPSNPIVAFDIDFRARVHGKFYFPPDVPSIGLNSSILSALSFGNDLRPLPEGVSIIMGALDEHCSLQPQTVDELVKKLFELIGMNARISTAGLVAVRLIELMGGLPGCRILKVAGVRRLFSEFGPEKSFTLGKALKSIGEHWLPEYDELFSFSGEGVQNRAKSLFNGLLARDTIRPGFEFICENCLLSGWYSLDDIGSEVACLYCGLPIRVALQLSSKCIRYRVSGLFSRNNKQAGAIPVALTISAISSVVEGRLQNKFGYVCSYEIESKSDPEMRCETDFIYLATSESGKFQVCLGECKSFSGEIDDRDVTRLSRVADMLSAAGIEAFLVFSKTGSWSNEELMRCLFVDGRPRGRVIILGAPELEGSFVYSNVRKLWPGLQSQAADLAAMSEVSLRTYGSLAV